MARSGPQTDSQTDGKCWTPSPEFYTRRNKDSFLVAWLFNSDTRLALNALHKKELVLRLGKIKTGLNLSPTARETL